MLMAGLLVTSCHDKEDVEYNGSLVSQKTEEFEKAFKEAFTSDINPNQDWGFGTTAKASTRTIDVNSNEWESKGYTIPSNITAREIEVVSGWFASHQYPTSESYEISDYFIQNVYASNITYNTETNGKNDKNGASHSENGSSHMDYITYYKKDGSYEHINNFNANSGQIQHVLNGSTYEFSYHDSYANYTSKKFVLRAISVDGVVGYYVGFDYESYGKDDGSEFHADGYYTDRIVKIVPGKGTVVNNNTNEDLDPGETPEADEVDTDVPEPTDVTDTHTYTAKTITTKTEYYKSRTLVQYGRVFCEDLGGNYASNRKDFDYNDVVFDAYLWMEEEYQKVTEVTTYEINTYKLVANYKTDNNGVPQKDSEGNNIIDYYDKTLISTTTRKEQGTPTYSKVPNTTPKFYADICLLACGATKSIKVGGNDSKVKEVHKALGDYAYDCMINTFDSNTERGGGFGYHQVAEPVTITQIDITEYVKDNDHISNPSIADIPVEVQWSSVAAKSVVAPTGGVPQKFMSTTKDNWTSERCFLGDAYPNFGIWVTLPDIPFNKGSDSQYLYNGYPGPEAGLDFSVTTGENSTIALEIETGKTTYTEETRESLVENNYYIEEDGKKIYTDENGNPISSSDNTGGAENTNNLVTLWSGSTTPNWYGSVVLTFQPLITSKSGTIRFYGTLTDTSNPWTTISLDNDQILDCKFTEPYVEVSVTQEIMNKINSYKSTVVNGQQFTLTSVLWVP